MLRPSLLLRLLGGESGELLLLLVILLVTVGEAVATVVASEMVVVLVVLIGKSYLTQPSCAAVTIFGAIIMVHYKGRHRSDFLIAKYLSTKKTPNDQNPSQGGIFGLPANSNFPP